MIAGIVSLLAVTIAFTGLVIWLCLPSSARLEEHGAIPLNDDEYAP